MPTFRYTAKRGPDRLIEGVVEADSRSGAITQLAQSGYVPIRIIEQGSADARPVERPTVGPAPKLPRVRAAHLTIFTRQFASLVRSAVPLLRSLRILEDQATHHDFRYVLHAVAEEVRQGETLSSAFHQFPTVFSPLYVNLIHSGEISGALDAVLERLAEQLEQEEAMRVRIRMALTYPGFVAVVGAATVVFLMTFVMPRLSRLLMGLGERLPLPTQILLAVSGWMSTWWCWAVLGGIVTALFLLWRALGERGRLLADRLLLRLPLVGPLIQQVEIARFARAFGLQITHGIAILQAIEVAIQVSTHRQIHAELSRLPEGLRQGTSLSACLQGSAIGTPFLVNTVIVGEENGKVGDALTEVAAYYERDSERLLQMAATLVEPMLIVGVGVIVGFIVLAVLLPIFEMSSINL